MNKQVKGKWFFLTCKIYQRYFSDIYFNVSEDVCCRCLGSVFCTAQLILLASGEFQEASFLTNKSNAYLLLPVHEMCAGRAQTSGGLEKRKKR